eukprot:9258527-Pyramimonas_sp.AAC.1
MAPLGPLGDASELCIEVSDAWATSRSRGCCAGPCSPMRGDPLSLRGKPRAHGRHHATEKPQSTLCARASGRRIRASIS